MKKMEVEGRSSLYVLEEDVFQKLNSSELVTLGVLVSLNILLKHIESKL